eukprot:TRINITY_DN3340_c1_g1_i1.p1 TRINITY_DN3340_c1_g1~~TRINITY_DN3340_c1_g1_i1.p1  ORF type:complete len:119 (-),score=4.08 TRINITY_DN3340_c1_g1_i1:21-377(-)
MMKEFCNLSTSLMYFCKPSFSLTEQPVWVVLLIGNDKLKGCFILLQSYVLIACFVWCHNNDAHSYLDAQIKEIKFFQKVFFFFEQLFFRVYLYAVKRKKKIGEHFSTNVFLFTVPVTL